MGTDSTICPGCQAKIQPNDKFCGECGRVLGEAGPTPWKKGTMLGLSAAGLGTAGGEKGAGAASEPAPRKETMLGLSGAAAPTDPALMKTMLGTKAFQGGRPSGEPSPGAAAAGSVAEPADAQKTRFGVDASASGPAQPLATGSGAPGGSAAQKTMLGMQSPFAQPKGAATGAAVGSAAPTAQSPRSPSPGPRARSDTPPSSGLSKGRTMLGMVGPLAGGTPAEAMPAASFPPSNRPEANVDPQTNRTMLGVAQPSLPAAAGEAAPAAGAVRVEGSSPSGPRFSVPSVRSPGPSTDEIAASVGVGRGRASGGRGKVVWAVLGALAAALVLAAAAFVLLAGGPAIEVSVVSGPQGDVLSVRAPEAAPGTKVRFQGVEVPVEAGVAAFPLSGQALKVGKNEVAIDVVEPDGGVSTSTVELQVDYRVRIDLAGLSDSPPTVSVVVDALAGTEVTVDGKPVALEQGHAAVEYPLTGVTGSTFDVEVPYRVRPPAGQAVDGELELHLPVASMQIDRPGEEVVTDAAQVEIGGAVEPGASVEVNGQAIDVHDGRFLYEAPLAKPGEYSFSVVARAADKAPRARLVKVNRVEDMAIAAASFEYARNLTYARIAQNPTIYKGQPVAFDGRVYNVEVQNGGSMLQMLVKDCPRGQKCQLWIDYAQATDATVGSMVRVLGTVSGQQQYRSKKGGVQTAPAVTARFILPLAK